MKAAYEKYHSRGFEILGMNMEHSAGGLTPEGYQKDIEMVKKFLAEKECTWMQAAQESIEKLTHDRFDIQGYSTVLLLDPQGKILALDPRGTELLDLLERLLGQKRAAQTGAAPGFENAGR